MAKKNELELKSNAQVTTPEADVEDGFFELLSEAESSDFDIARLTLIQPTSKLEGEPGDVIDSSTNEKVSGLNQKLAFAPVGFLKDFAISEVDTKKFRRNEPKGPHNAEFAVFDNRIGPDPDGVMVERKERINLFLVQVADLEHDLPKLYRVIIKPSGFKEAKKLMSEWTIQSRSRILPFKFIWSIEPKLEKNDKGKYYVYQFQKMMDGRSQKQIDPAHLEKVKFWVKTLAQNKAEVLKTQGSGEEEIRTVSEDVVPF